jgi:uncharacterized protein
MDFEWDSQKRLENVKKHDVDFLDAALVFSGSFVAEIDDRFDYGEIRYRAIGEAIGLVITVIYVRRDDAIRIISARKASKHERRKHSEIFTRRD